MPRLRTYQLEAVKAVLDRKKILIADDMGLGKCAESLSAIRAIRNRQGYGPKTLIACPASVMPHWEDEVRLWYDPNAKITKIQTPTYDQDIKRAENSDIVITSYPTLSYYGRVESKINKLKGLGFQAGIVDEVHNSKNPASIRTNAVKDTFDSLEYLTLLSGTPIPNTIVDMYMLLSLLDKEHFPINPENPRAILSGFYSLFRKDPEFVKRVLDDRMIRRTVDDYLEDVPQLNLRDLEVNLDGPHREVYLDLLENDNLPPGVKLNQLRSAALDPNLVNPDFLDPKLAQQVGTMESNVYEAMDTLIERVADENGKLLFFSNLREGVTDYLKGRWKIFNPLIIDGIKTRKVKGYDPKHDIDKREYIRRKFQEDPNHKVLIATTVMDEGVDLTAATDIVQDLPYTPAAFDQRNRRSQRIGEIEKDKVNVHVIKTKLDLIPTIHEGTERMLEDKRRVITYIMDKPHLITKDDLDEIKNGKPAKSKHISLVSNPRRTIGNHLGNLRGKGFDKILKYYEKDPKIAEYVARIYASNWDGYYGGNTANLYAKVIKTLEEKESLERKLDLASGPFSLSRRLREPVTNLDINRYMLNAGKILEEKEKIIPGNKTSQGSFHQIPYKDASFDLVNLGLALHMSKTKLRHKGKEIRERESTLREINRVLRPGGYAIITLPCSQNKKKAVISKQNFSNFYKGLEQLGFEVLPFSGFYNGPKDSKFKVYLAGLRKTSEPTEEPLDEELLGWKMDSKLAERRRGRSRNERKQPAGEKERSKREYVGRFYHSEKETGLETLVRDSIK